MVKEDDFNYFVSVLESLRAQFDGVGVLFPDDLQCWPYGVKPDVTFTWAPIIDGEKVLLRIHLTLPGNFGSPLSKIYAPKVEFTEPNLRGKSLLYRNSIPHTFPVDSRKLDRFSVLHQGENVITSYPWVRVCWHFPGPSGPSHPWSGWVNREWNYSERLNLVLEESVDWVRGYIAWRELGEWFYGGINHKPDYERIQYDRETFRRDHLSSASQAALAQRLAI